MKEAQLIASLADIKLPTGPDTPVGGMTNGMVVIVAILLLVIWWTLRKRSARRPGRRDPGGSAKRQALKELKTLQRAWQRGDINDRTTAYRIAALLRLGSGEDNWRQAVEAKALAAHLDLLRYQPRTDRPLDEQAFSDAADVLTGATAKRC